MMGVELERGGVFPNDGDRPLTRVEKEAKCALDPGVIGRFGPD